MDLNIVQIFENTWYIDEPIVRMFLLTGTKEALLIDCGMMTSNALDVVKEITDLPVKLILTHADRDHIASIKQFETFYMNAKEEENLKFNAEELAYIPVTEGMQIDLGNRVVEVLEIPGHTPGSIAILDVNNRILFGGDTVQDGEIFMFGPQRNLGTYLTSLLKLESEKDRFDLILPSHGSLPLPPDMVMDLYQEAKRIKMGKGEWVEAEMFDTAIRRYETSKATFLLGQE